MSAENPSKLSLLRPLAIIVVAALIAFALYATKPERDAQVQEKTKVLVDAIEVYRETLQLKIQSQGTVMPATETRLASEVQGRIIEVAPRFVAGGFVEKGDVLLRIDDLEYKTALARARASLASAKKVLAEERGRAEVAYQDWLRYNKEGKRSAQAKSLALREPQIAEAEANLQAARADLTRAEENLSRTAIKAPYDGLIRSRDVDLGQHVSVGTLLGVSFATDTVEVRLPVPEHKVALLTLPGQAEGQQAGEQQTQEIVPIELSLEVNNQRYRWPAELARIESVVDERSRVLYIVARVADPYQLLPASKSVENPPLRVGTFVNAVIAGKTLNNIVRVPQNVIQTDNRVWLVNSAGSIYEQSVNIIANDSDFAYIDEGLNEADRIAMGYVDVSVPGASVTIANLIQLEPARPLFAPDSDDKPVLMPANTAPAANTTTETIARSAESASPLNTELESNSEDTASRGI